MSNRCDSRQNKTQTFKKSKLRFLPPISILPLCSQSAQPFQPLATQAEAWQAIPGVSVWVMNTVRRGYSLQFAFSPLAGSQESLLCLVRALKIYIERSASYRKSELLFVGFGNRAKGGPVMKQIIFRWLVQWFSNFFGHFPL